MVDHRGDEADGRIADEDRRGAAAVSRRDQDRDR